MTTPWEVLSVAVTRLSDRVNDLPRFREATVVTSSPLMVLFDTDSSPTAISRSLVAYTAAGNRVLTLRIKHYLWVIGVKGGEPVPVPPTPVTYPIFEVAMSADQSWSGALNYKRVLFNLKRMDKGNNFNTALNRFVAPLKGTYEFDASIVLLTTTGGPAIEFYKNGVKTPRTSVLGYNNQYMPAYVSEFIDLDIGDYVELWLGNANGTAVTLSSAHGNYFKGKLVYREGS